MIRSVRFLNDCVTGILIMKKNAFEIPFIIFLASLDITAGINCYTCSSHNGSNPNCEDPFNPAMSTYNEKCMVPKRGHIGLFPANFCIKIDGKNERTMESTVIRACVMKSMDSQCGGFKYENITMKGCIQSCDYDGCNSSSKLFAAFNLIHFMETFIFISKLLFF